VSEVKTEPTEQQICAMFMPERHHVAQAEKPKKKKEVDSQEENKGE